jgi:hypothetical protein
MLTLIWGAPLPRKGTLRIIVHIGWGENLEKLEFVHDLAQLKQASRSSTS